METLEHSYAVSLLPLASFAIDVYGDDPCRRFIPRPLGEDDLTDDKLRLMAQMNEAITIIQLKLEAQISRRRRHYEMEDRLLLDKINHDVGTVTLGGAVHPLLDTHFPTVDPAGPYTLSARERYVIEKLRLSFIGSRRLQEHVRFLFSRGNVYLVCKGESPFPRLHLDECGRHVQVVPNRRRDALGSAFHGEG